MPVRRPSACFQGVAGIAALVLAGSTLVGSTAPAAAERSATHRSVSAGSTAAGSTAAGPAAPSLAPSAGAAGIGDPYFPQYGNGGYRVGHYDIDVSFNPATEKLRGRTVIAARTTKSLSRFNLDLVLPASKVLVNGVPAAHRRTAHELIVTPRQPLRDGQQMRVVVRYAGVPQDRKVAGARPWVTTRDGAVAVGEPEIAAWWFPSNDHPSDKAGFDITLRVPRGVEAISNGKLLSRRNRGGQSVWRWREDDPMATYLAFAAIGQYDIVRGRTDSGRPYLYAYSKLLRSQRAARKSVSATASITAWLARTWGAYPYDEIGGVVIGKWIGFALENQTRPVYSRAFFQFSQDRSVVAHEMAHQWFGDAVAVERWRNIWLNEGFATYSEWLYAAHSRKVTVDQIFKRTYQGYRNNERFWNVPIGAPGVKRMFNPAVYDRGAMAAHALRNKIGSADFFRTMRTWVRTSDGNGTTAELQALAEKVSGRRLDGFFDVWLFRTSRPRPTVSNGFPRDF
jgi:aminopeptidase N